MARPKREDEWVPVTVRMAASAALRLRVAAAKRGVNQGRILDELVLANLPPVEGAHGPKPLTPWTIERLQRELDVREASKPTLAKELGISLRAVNDWFARGRIPAERQEAVQKVIQSLRRTHRR